MSKVWIGTSGWTYEGWRGPFYPPDVAKTKWLCWYAGQFPTTEINGSFYRTPSLKAGEPAMHGPAAALQDLLRLEFHTQSPEI